MIEEKKKEAIPHKYVNQLKICLRPNKTKWKGDPISDLMQLAVNLETRCMVLYC